MNSKYNNISPIYDSSHYFIVNLLSRNADIIGPETADRFLKGSLLPDEVEEFRQKGYITDEETETAEFRKRYIEFMEERDKSEVQLFFVPTYQCNFNCTYCYQEEYSYPEEKEGDAVIGPFFRYIDTVFAGKNKYVTIFGGEPLLPGERTRKKITALVEGAAARNLGIAVVTNGYHLTEYLDLLEKASIREIQITLDGPADLQNRRRPLKGGGETFDNVVQGIDESLRRELPVNLRVVVDKENLASLPELAEFAVNKGWTEKDNFKTQLGRNYELHTCQEGREKIYDRLELYREVYKLLEAHPQIGLFHRPAFSVTRFLFDNGELPMPLFDSCPGCTTEWAFDYAGRIYSCTATVGKEDEVLGTFYPDIELNEKAVDEWEDRDITAIAECIECESALACGGGCASVAKNRTGTIMAPDCRPVKGLLELGISAYFEKKIIKDK